MADKARVQDDLYEYVNGSWLKHAKIPGDKVRIGGFSKLSDDVEKTLMKELEAFSNGERKIPNQPLERAVVIYKQAKDSTRREEEGIKPALNRLDTIAGLKNIGDLNKILPYFVKENYPLPFSVGVEPNMKNTFMNSFVISSPSLFLPDVTYYQGENGLIDVFSQMISELLKFTNLSKAEQEEYLRDAIAFDKILSGYVKSQEEWADYADNYHPMDREKACELFGDLDLNRIFKALTPIVPEEIIAYDPRFVENFSNILNEENFTLFVHWAYVTELLNATPYLSDSMREKKLIYSSVLQGVSKLPSINKYAYRTTDRFFSEVLGVYYGKKYFGKEAKTDVENIVNELIGAYKARLKDNAFLSESTKAKAIVKLDNIAVKIGYPEKLSTIGRRLPADESLSLYENIVWINSRRIMDNLSKLDKPVNRDEWVMPANMVNACYNPFSNDITFPAAILQPPFYSIEQKRSQNLGGIGTVIGHEISHAFDNNGALFDEYGNMAEWWEPEDYEKFKNLTQQMIDQFDGIPFANGTINGKLVVSENIADNGGMSAALTIMHNEGNTDFRGFFKNYAKTWCSKTRTEYETLLITVDVHAPGKLRTNMQPRNFEEWYEAFDVHEGDGMYLPPEKRIRIW